MHAVTAYVWGARSVLRALDVPHLARQLYLLLPGSTHDECDSIADSVLNRGGMSLLGRYQTALIRGDVELPESAPALQLLERMR